MLRGHFGKEVKDIELFRGLGLVKQAHLLAILIAGSQRPRGGPSFLETEKAQELYSVIVGLASVGFQDFCKVPICYRLPLEDVVLCLGHNKLGDDQLGGFHLLVFLRVSRHAGIRQDPSAEEVGLEI